MNAHLLPMAAAALCFLMMANVDKVWPGKGMKMEETD
jgi:hypothetical protein